MHIVDSVRIFANDTRCYIVSTAHTDQFRNSFYVKTVVDWNKLNKTQVQAETITDFSGLTCGSHTQYHVHPHIQVPMLDSYDLLYSYSECHCLCEAKNSYVRWLVLVLAYRV